MQLCARIQRTVLSPAGRLMTTLMTLIDVVETRCDLTSKFSSKNKNVHLMYCTDAFSDTLLDSDCTCLTVPSLRKHYVLIVRSEFNYVSRGPINDVIPVRMSNAN